MYIYTVNRAKTNRPDRLGKSTILVGNISIPFLIIYRTSKQKLSKDIQNLNSIMNQSDLTFIEHSTQQQHNIHSFQVYIEHLPK